MALTDSSSHTPVDDHMVRLTASYAVGERRTTIVQAVAEVALFPMPRWGVQLKVPYLYANGDLGSNQGVGDPVLTTSWTFLADKDRKLVGMAGVKLPANRANASVDGQALPMPYQTSLGTTDLLAGASYRHKRWRMTMAYQHVLTQGNRNGFRHSVWMDEPAALGYFESWELERTDDAVARLQYAWSLGRLVIQPGLLAIYHMGRDTRLETPGVRMGGSMQVTRQEVVGSEGLTLNLTADARYRLSDHWSLELSYGSPLIVRKERPDGLTRFMVLNVGVAHRFGR